LYSLLSKNTDQDSSDLFIHILLLIQGKYDQECPRATSEHVCVKPLCVTAPHVCL